MRRTCEVGNGMFWLRLVRRESFLFCNFRTERYGDASLDVSLPFPRLPTVLFVRLERSVVSCLLVGVRRFNPNKMERDMTIGHVVSKVQGELINVMT